MPKKKKKKNGKNTIMVPLVIDADLNMIIIILVKKILCLSSSNYN